MQKLPGKRFGILATVSLVIILAMGFYYFHVQSVKEAKVERQAFKALYRYAGDLVEKEQEMVKKWRNNPTIREESNNINELINSWITEKEDTINTFLKRSTDGTFNIYKLRSDYYKNINDVNWRNKKAVEKVVDKINETLPRSSIVEDVFKVVTFNDIIKEEHRYDVGEHLNDFKIKGAEITKEEVFSDILDKSFFSGFIAFDEDTAIYNEFKYTFIEIKQNKEKQSVSLDSLLHIFKSEKKFEFSLDGGSSSFNIQNPYELQLSITIKGEDYQMFVVKAGHDKIQYLAGLIPSTKYASLKRGFDRALISLISVCVLLLMFSIPIIKLFVVAPGESYTSRSLATLVISTVCLVFIIAYFFLYYSNLRYIKKHVASEGEHLDSIAQTIKSEFKSEFNTMLKLSNDVKDWVASKEKMSSSYDPKQDRALVKNYFEVIDSIGKGLKYEIWKSGFVIPTKGEKRGKSQYDVRNTIRYGGGFEDVTNIDVSHREYYQNADKYVKSLSSNKEIKFGLQSIFSLNTARPVVVLSQKVNNGLIACLASEMYSINDAILPYGYSFCVIDSDGKVWFHEHAKNNIRENLFTETDQHPELKAAVLSHRRDMFKLKYKMKNMMMQVEPLDTDLDLFIVTMCEVNNYVQLVNQSGYFIIAGYVVILLFWIIIGVLYRLWKNSRCNMNNPPHILLYFFPISTNKKNIFKVLLFNFLISVLLLVFVRVFINTIYVIHWIPIIALLGAGLMLWNVWILNKQEHHLRKRYYIISILAPLACFTLFEYILLDEKWGLSFVLSIGFLFFMNVLFTVYYSLGNVNLKTELEDVLSKFRNFVSNNLSYKAIYYPMVFSWLLVFVMVPLFVLYSSIFQQESLLYYMEQQRHVADHIINRNVKLNETKGQERIGKLLANNGRYYESFHELKAISCGSYCNHIKKNVIKFSTPDKNGREVLASKLINTENYAKVFGQARANMFFINNLIEDRGNRVKPSYIDSDDDNFMYRYFATDDDLVLHINQGGYPHNSTGLIMLMHKPVFGDILNRYLGFLYSFIVIVVLFWIYFPRIANKYLFPQFKYSKVLFTEKQSQDQLHELVEGENKYIVTMPDKDFYESCIKNEETRMYRLHLPQNIYKLLYDDISKKHVFLFIDHMSFKGVNHLDKFVTNLEQIIENGQFLSFNIVCFKVPRVLIQHFRDSLISELRKSNKKTAKKQMQLETTLKRLINCLAYFSVSYVPIVKQPINSDIVKKLYVFKDEWKDKFTSKLKGTSTEKLVKWENHIGWIEAEINNTAALIGKYKLFRRQASLTENENNYDCQHLVQPNNIVVNEDNVYQAYLINRTYYQKIWDSCSNEEKSILYDIASDYVINLHKNGIVNVLINKGLILNGQFLRLFNLSFSLFVSRQGDEVDGINTHLRADSKTGWSQYSLPLKLLGVAVVVFLIVTQQEFLTSIQSILISIGAILTFALRFFNFSTRTGT